MNTMTNKTVWITGASSGIGHDLARALAKARNFVYVSARSEKKLNALRDAYPQNIFVVPLDVGDLESFKEAEKQLKGHTDHIDCLIACAGTCEYDNDISLSSALFERITKINYLGVVETVRVALPLLRNSSNNPHIVGVSSLASVMPFPRAAAYGASKAALDYFLQSLKIDIQDQGIDITIVRPGFVDTPLTKRNDFDMPFLMSTDAAVKEILKAIDSRSMFADFPRKMSLPLKLMRLFPSLWMKSIAPKFRKTSLI